MKNKLKGKMAEYGLSVGDMAEIIGVSYNTMIHKLHGRHEFTLGEASKAIEYFNSTGDDCRIDDIFFSYLSNYVDKERTSG